MIRNLDFNDTYPGGHPSDALGALFAAAPHLKVSGEQLITATVIAIASAGSVPTAVRAGDQKRDRHQSQDSTERDHQGRIDVLQAIRATRQQTGSAHEEIRIIDQTLLDTHQSPWAGRDHPERTRDQPENRHGREHKGRLTC